MRKPGSITRWDAARGFGFIRSPESSADVFFHVRDFRGTTAPVEGMRVVFEEIHVGGKGPRAMAVQPAATTFASPPNSASARGPSRHTSAASSSSSVSRHPKSADTPRCSRSGARAGSRAAAPPGSGLATVLMAGWAAALLWLAWAQRLPWWVLGAVLVLNLATMVIYAIDKSAAHSGAWRVSEKQLHLLALLGGWPGAWWAQQWLRHKSSKQPFRAVYWGTVGVHCAALLVFASGILPRSLHFL